MRKLFVFALMCAAATFALGQSKTSSVWNCPKPANMQSIAVPDGGSHAYVIAQFTCTASKGEIAGSKEKDGTATEFDEVNGSNSTGHGIVVETLANGDKLHIKYENTGVMKNGMIQSGSNKWQITEGTGKVKGIKGSGTCAGKGGADGASTWTCTGTYSLAK